MPIIHRLQATGFVQRHPHPDSGREVTLTLTPAGRVRLARVREGRENLLHQALQDLPEPEHTALSSALDTLHRALTAVRPHLHALPADTTTSAPLPGRRIGAARLNGVLDRQVVVTVVAVLVGLLA